MLYNSGWLEKRGFDGSKRLDRISVYILQIANETKDEYNLLICGDFSSRTGIEQDFVNFDNMAKCTFVPDEYVLDDNILRFSQDDVIHTNGRKLLDFC